jgi:hypothetical protein
MLMCQEMSQSKPTTMLVDARPRRSPGQKEESILANGPDNGAGAAVTGSEIPLMAWLSMVLKRDYSVPNVLLYPSWGKCF